MNSTILDRRNGNDLMKLCEFDRDQEWDLIYRASDDGFSSKNFHSNCDNKASTLTVIKTTKKEIFGGYIERAWESDGYWLKDPNAFIFTLANSDNSSFKFKNADSMGTKAVYCDLEKGPSFGHDDIELCSHSNIKLNSFYQFGGNYKNRSFIMKESKTYFKTVDIEIYQKRKIKIN